MEEKINTIVIKGKFRDFTVSSNVETLQQTLRFMDNYSNLWTIDRDNILDILKNKESLAYQDIVNAFDEILNDRDEIEAKLYKILKQSLRTKNNEKLAEEPTDQQEEKTETQE